MRAFVKTNNGTFPNLNFYMAWEAFNTMGYNVICFEEKDIDTLDINVDTPVFAGVTVFRKIIDKLGVDYAPFNCYPEALDLYYRRNIRRSTLGEEREKFNRDHIPVFVKPVLPKQFIGQVWESILQLIPLTKIPDSAEVWVCEPIKIDSEFRVYVHDGEVLGVKHYWGDWSKIPSKGFVEQVVKTYKPSPIAYGVDIGVNNQYGFVIEANDGCNLGNYGLDSIHYGEMIVSRWYEIMATHKVDKEFNKEMNYWNDSLKFWEDRNDTKNQEWIKGIIDEKIQSHFTGSDWGIGTIPSKNLRITDASKKLKEKALKAYADEIHKTLKGNTHI